MSKSATTAQPIADLPPFRVESDARSIVQPVQTA
jgi:hypothetical protein